MKDKLSERRVRKYCNTTIENCGKNLWWKQWRISSIGRGNETEFTWFNPCEITRNPETTITLFSHLVEAQCYFVCTPVCAEISRKLPRWNGTRLEKIPALSKNKFRRKRRCVCGGGRFRKGVKSKVAQLLRDNAKEKLPLTKVNFPMKRIK